MKPIPNEFPIDPNGWAACVRGTGDEEQTWTCGRDVGKAVVELCKAKQWVRRRNNCRRVLLIGQEQITYVAAEWSTFNKAIRVMEAFHGLFNSCFLFTSSLRSLGLLMSGW